MTPGARSLYINLGLLAAVLALAAALWLAPDRDDPVPGPFAHIDVDALQQIQIIIPRQPVTLLRRRDGVWLTPEPAASELDPQRLRNLLNIVRESVAAAYPAAELGLDEFGLEPPVAVLKLDGHVFLFGADVPLSRRRYVLYEGTLYLLPDMYYPLLSRGIANLLRQPAAANADAAEPHAADIDASAR
jgi:hypothetical protein